MKRLVVGIILLIGTIGASASPKSYYQVLGDMYKVGTQPSLKQLINVAWAGRCFTLENPNVPSSGGFIFRVSKADVGPIAAIKYQGFDYSIHEDYPANFFDNKLYSQIIDSTFWTEFAGYEITAKELESWFSYLTISDGAIIKKTSKPHWLFTISLKLSGRYLVAETAAQAVDVGPLGKAEVSKRCYYFVPEYTQGEK